MSTPSLSTNSGDLIDLQQQVARLQALLEASRQVHAALQLDDVLTSVLRILVRELELAGALFTHPILMYGDMPPDPWEDCVHFPIRGKDNKNLTELIVAPGAGRVLSIYEMDFLEGLILQAAVAIENAKFHERSLEWARVQQDLDAARAIQRSLLPQIMPEIYGYSVAARSSPCYEVGGDYVDLVSLPDGKEIMAVADVAGKGLASAIVSTSFRAAFRATASAGLPLVELVERLNQQHYAEGLEARRRYVTAIFLQLDPTANQIEFVNAGHNPAFLVSSTESVRQVDASGTPIGLVPTMRYGSEIHSFPPGSRVLFYTDGLTEVFRGDDEFGPERLLAAFMECKSQDSAAILETLWERLRDFSGDAPQQDDMTALALVHEQA
jgi:phosphoserine phosphatase RsbU/P